MNIPVGTWQILGSEGQLSLESDIEFPLNFFYGRIRYINF
jgi:hypothetical protein